MVSIEARRRMSIAKLGNQNAKGHHPSKEARIKMGQSMLGKHHSEESRRKISLSLKGHRGWNKGMKFPIDKYPNHGMREKGMLDKLEIDGMYWDDELTIREIAKIKGCSVSPVKTCLKRTRGFRNKRESRILAFKKGKVNWQDSEYREKMIKAFLNAKRPTSLEMKAIAFFRKYKLPFTYCGNGTLLIGYKNPDFYENNGKKICLETSNKRTKDWRYSGKGGWGYYEQQRVEHFAKHGWKCLVIWEEELKNPITLVEKIEREVVPYY